MDIEVFTDPNRVVLRTVWGETDVTEVTAKRAVIRYKGGIKSEILRDLEKGERLYVLDDGAGDEWAQVVTEDGYLGWVLNDDIKTPYTMTLEEPAFEEPVFQHISRDYKINMAWSVQYRCQWGD